LLKSDDAAGEVKKATVVFSDALPAHEQSSEAVVPRVGAFDDPSPRFSANASEQRMLSATTDVRDDSSTAHGSLRIGVVVAFVQAQVHGPTRTSRCAQDDSVESLGDQPLVMDVRARDLRGQGNAATVS